MTALPDYASCEHIPLDPAGYDLAGVYYGRGVGSVFRVSANDPADGGIQLDITVRARSYHAACEILLAAIAAYPVRLAYWQSRERSYRTPLMTAIDWDKWCDRAAISDATVHF